jgi:hypothetical protein
MAATNAPNSSFLMCFAPFFVPMVVCHQRKRAARTLADKLPRIFGLCPEKSRPFAANENRPAIAARKRPKAACHLYDYSPRIWPRMKKPRPRNLFGRGRKRAGAGGQERRAKLLTQELFPTAQISKALGQKRPSRVSALRSSAKLPCLVAGPSDARTKPSPPSLSRREAGLTRRR